MQHWKLGKWCNQAVRLIRYPPDRKEVFEELRQHVDDRSDLFLAQGFSQEEAVEKTLLAMGDADELAPQLAAIHKPFWGFAWSITKSFAIIAFIGMLLAVLIYRVPYIWAEFKELFRDVPDSLETYLNWDPYEMTEHPDHGTRQLYLTPGCEYTDSGYTVTLTDAAVWKHDPGEYILGHLSFRLRITNPMPWASEPSFVKYLTAEDSLGNKYTFNHFDDLSDGYRGYVSGKLKKVGLSEWTLESEFINRFTKDVQWVDICYRRDGRNMIMRIWLSRGGA